MILKAISHTNNFCRLVIFFLVLQSKDETHYQNFYEFPKFRIKLLILILLHFNIVRIIY